MTRGHSSRISRIKLFFIAEGASALLIREDSGLSAVRKAEACKMVNERMMYVFKMPLIIKSRSTDSIFLVRVKYHASESQHMQDNPFHPPFSPSSHEMVQSNNTILSGDEEAYQCTTAEALDFVRMDPFSVAERLYGVGVEGDLDLRWRLLGLSLRRGHMSFDIQYGIDESREIDQDAFIALLRRTKGVYMHVDYFDS
jgi:hypothetical protein